MKEVILCLALVIELVRPQVLSAQGTLYLSSLGSASTTNTIVANDSWRAADFRTGTNSLGYTLNSIQLLMAPASGNPSGFSVMLYGSGSVPGSYLATLNGPDPSAGGVFTYAASSLTLAPATYYYVVVTSGTSVSTGAYKWNITNVGPTVSDGWRPGGFFGSSDGTSWIPSRPNPFQFAVEATAIPEPSISAMIALGLAVLSFWRCSFICQILGKHQLVAQW